MSKDEPVKSRSLSVVTESQSAIDGSRRKKRLKWIAVLKTVFGFVLFAGRVLNLINKIYQWLVDFF